MKYLHVSFRDHITMNGINLNWWSFWIMKTIYIHYWNTKLTVITHPSITDSWFVWSALIIRTGQGCSGALSLFCCPNAVEKLARDLAAIVAALSIKSRSTCSAADKDRSARLANSMSCRTLSVVRRSDQCGCWYREVSLCGVKWCWCVVTWLASVRCDVVLMCREVGAMCWCAAMWCCVVMCLSLRICVTVETQLGRALGLQSWWSLYCLSQLAL